MTDPVATPGPGRPPVLDEAKRKRIIALLANGSSRRIAAHYVGCAQSTITRTATPRSPIRGGVGPGRTHAEIEALHNLRKAARNERYWQAAAWLLERRNPEDFASGNPMLRRRSRSAMPSWPWPTSCLRACPTKDTTRLSSDWQTSLALPRRTGVNCSTRIAPRRR